MVDWQPADEEVYEPKPNGAEDNAKRPPFGLIAFNQIKAGTEPPYLVKGLIPREGITVIWGEPKSGKSFQTLDLVMAIVRGLAYRGRRVQQGTAIYCAAEGATGCRNRVDAYRQRHRIKGNLPFYLMPDSLKLQTDAPALIERIRADLGGKRPSVVVLDTLNRSMEGDENSPGDMGAYIKAADEIRQAFRCAVVIVHHCGTEGKRPRGHTSLTGAADAQLSVKRTEDGTVCTEVEWMKDGPEGDTLYSRLEVVVVGIDQDDDEITSCVVVEAEPVVARPKQKKLGKNEQSMFDILAENMPNGLTKEEWNGLGRDDGIGVRRRADLNDCRRRLKSKKLVRETQGRWYVTSR